MEEFNLIIGIHSIVAALKNEDRSDFKLVATEDALTEIKKLVNISDIIVEMYASHKVQEEAKKYFKDLNLEYHRVPSGAFLIASPLKTLNVIDLYKAMETKSDLRILCLDQITDVHNAAAILRTASFYNVDYVVVPDKKSFGLTPSFFRIASGAAEYVPLVETSKLVRTVTKLKELGGVCVALSEHAKGDFSKLIKEKSEVNFCLILGREDVGISNAVLRVSDFHMSLPTQGDIQSLNVSIAGAVAMEKCFGNF